MWQVKKEVLLNVVFDDKVEQEVIAFMTFARLSAS